jgi:N-acetylglucosaminyldiphosphoundecaprenol N-acetyl-beta-D-mannosaminyltransferase
MIAAPAATGRRRRLLGCPVDVLTMAETVELVLARLKAGADPCFQFSLNAAKVVEARRNPEVLELLDRASIVNADGQSLVWAGALLGVRLPERVAGIDLFLTLVAAFEREGVSVYFLGAREDVLGLTVDRLRSQHPGLRIAGSHHGHFPPEEDARVAAEIAASAPDALFVAMSSPRKEYWIDTYQALTGARFAMGVGGSFDVVAGKVKRAPALVQRLGLEWAYRTAQEPLRLTGRYARTNAAFMGLVAAAAAQRLRGARP